MVTKEEVRRTKKEEEPHKALGNVSQTSLSVDESRVERFYEWHRERVRDRAQASPPRTAAALKAARSLLAREPCATVIQERLDFALGRPFWASKVLSLVDLDRYFAAITAEHLAVKERRNGREDTSVSDPDYPVSTDYGGVRS